MNRLRKMGINDILGQRHKLRDRISNVAVTYTDDTDGWVILADYNELMTSLKITLEVLDNELNSRGALL